MNSNIDPATILKTKVLEADKNIILKKILVQLYNNNDNILQLLTDSECLENNDRDKIETKLYHYLKNEINNLTDQKLNEYINIIASLYTKYRYLIYFVRREDKEENILEFIQDQGIFLICFNESFIQSEIQETIVYMTINEIKNELEKYNITKLDEILKKIQNENEQYIKNIEYDDDDVNDKLNNEQNESPDNEYIKKILCILNNNNEILIRLLKETCELENIDRPTKVHFFGSLDLENILYESFKNEITALSKEELNEYINIIIAIYPQYWFIKYKGRNDKESNIFQIVKNHGIFTTCLGGEIFIKGKIQEVLKKQIINEIKNELQKYNITQLDEILKKIQDLVENNQVIIEILQILNNNNENILKLLTETGYLETSELQRIEEILYKTLKDEFLGLYKEELNEYIDIMLAIHQEYYISLNIEKNMIKKTDIYKMMRDHGVFKTCFGKTFIKNETQEVLKKQTINEIKNNFEKRTIMQLNEILKIKIIKNLEYQT